MPPPNPTAASPATQPHTPPLPATTTTTTVQQQQPNNKHVGTAATSTGTRPLPPPPPYAQRHKSMMRKCMNVLLVISVVGACLPVAWVNVKKMVVDPMQVWVDEPTTAYEYMNASVFAVGGNPHTVLQRKLVLRPQRGPKQLLVKVLKAALNPVDWKYRKNARRGIFPLPMITGKDMAGVVVEADTTSMFKPGDRVMASLPPFPSRWGTFADYVVVNDEFAAHIPDSMSYSHAAALPLVGLTAHQALAAIGAISTNNPKLLVIAGSGGVGHIVIQLAKRLGYEVWTTSTNENFCKSLGADHVINYQTQRLADVIAPHTFDVIIDVIGGKTIWQQNMPLLRQSHDAVYVNVLNGGMIDSYGGMDAAIALEFPVMAWYKMKHWLLRNRPNYHIVVLRADGENLAYLGELVASKQLKVEIEKEFKGWDVVPDMHEVLQGGRVKGKLTIQLA